MQATETDTGTIKQKTHKGTMERKWGAPHRDQGVKIGNTISSESEGLGTEWEAVVVRQELRDKATIFDLCRSVQESSSTGRVRVYLVHSGSHAGPLAGRGQLAKLPPSHIQKRIGGD